MTNANLYGASANGSIHSESMRGYCGAPPTLAIRCSSNTRILPMHGWMMHCSPRANLVKANLRKTVVKGAKFTGTKMRDVYR